MRVIENELNGKIEFSDDFFTYRVIDKNLSEVAVQYGPGILGKHTTYPSKGNTLSIYKEINISQTVTRNNIPYTVIRIEKDVFHKCFNLESISIPSSIMHIEWAFYQCFSLKEILVDPDNAFYSSQNGVLYNKKKNELVAYPNANGKHFSLPRNVRKIKSFAFKTCIDLSELFIPEGLTEIGHNVFFDCKNLELVHLPDSMKKVGLVQQTTTKFSYKGKIFTAEDLFSLFNPK